MAGEATDVTIRARYNDRGASKGLSGLVSKITRIGTTVMMVAAAATMVAGVLGTRLGAQVEKNLITVATIAGATRKELAGITAEARRIGATTAYTAAEASQGMIALARAGLRTGQVISATADSMYLAGATASDMGTATRSVAATLGQFGMAAEDTRRITDAFAYSTSRSLFNLTELSVAMRYGGTTAKGLGMDLEDAVTAVSMFANLGLEGSMAGMAFRMAMVQLASGSDKVRNALARVNIAFEDVNPATHDYITLIENLAKGNLDAATAVEIFGTRAGLNMLQVINQVKQGTLNLREFREGILEAQRGSGLAAEMYGKMMDNVSGDWAILKSSFQELHLTMFDSYKDSLRKMLQSTTEFVRQGTAYYALFAINTGTVFAKLKEFIVRLFSDWSFVVGLWFVFVEVIKRCWFSLAHFTENTVKLIWRVSSFIWAPIGAMFGFLILKLREQFLIFLNWMIEKYEKTFNYFMFTPLKVTLPRFGVTEAPEMQEMWEFAGQVITEEFGKIAEEANETMEKVKGEWAGFSDVVKYELGDVSIELKKLEDVIKEITDKTPVNNILPPDQSDVVQNVGREIDELVSRAETLASLSDLIGKGLLGSEYELEILREKKQIIGELEAEIAKIEALPVNTERLEHLQQLIEAYEKLTETVELSFEEQYAAAEGFREKMRVVFQGVTDTIRSEAETMVEVMRTILDTITSSIAGFFHDLVAESGSATRNFAANVIDMVGKIAQILGTLIFLAGIGFVSLGWISGGPAIAAGLGLLALGGVAQGVATKMRRQNEAAASAEEERRVEFREGVARNVPEGRVARTEVAVTVQDASGRSILDARGRREAQRIVLESMRELKDQGKLAVVMA